MFTIHLYTKKCSLTVVTCNQNNDEDSPKQQDNHHDKGYLSSAKSEPALEYNT